jgi:hypothetical protein
LPKSLCTFLIVTALAAGGCTSKSPSTRPVSSTTTAPLGELLFEGEPTTSVAVNTTEVPPGVTTTALVTTPPAKPGEPEIAGWELKTPDPALVSTSTRFRATVSRLSCNSGVTGEVFPPEIVYGKFAIIVTFTVGPNTGFDCPLNQPVLFDVLLKEPIGTRNLVDGSCIAIGIEGANPRCSNHGIRFTPN